MIKQAFYKSIPVMAGYIVLGTGFGILMHNAGYGVLWTAAMSIFIYAGSMQYVGVNLLTGGASVITTALTTVMVNARHLFYSISMVDLYSRKSAGRGDPFFDGGHRILHDGAVHSGLYGTVAHDERPHSGADRTSEHVGVPDPLWKGQVPDPGHAADHIGPHASPGKRGVPGRRGAPG